MSQILQSLLGRKAKPARVLGSAEPRVHHGPIGRLPPFFRTGALSSVEQLAERYKGRVQGAAGTIQKGAQAPIGLSASKVLALGMTVLFEEISGIVDGAPDWLRALERELGLPQQSAILMAFANAPGSGLPAHHDTHDGLLIHLIGRKRLDVAVNTYATNPTLQFRPEDEAPPVFGATYADGFPQDSAELEERFETWWLEPGSVVFLPAGCWHASAGQTDATLSAVVQFRIPTQAELISHMLTLQLLRDPIWRSRAYGVGRKLNDAEIADRLRPVLDRLAELDPQRMRDAWTLFQHEAGSKVGFPRGVAWERYIRLPDARATLVEPAIGNASLAVRSGAEVVARHKRTVPIPAEAVPAVRWILGCQRAFTREEVQAAAPELADDAAIALLDALCEAQLVRPIPG